MCSSVASHLPHNFGPSSWNAGNHGLNFHKSSQHISEIRVLFGAISYIYVHAVAYVEIFEGRGAGGGTIIGGQRYMGKAREVCSAGKIFKMYNAFCYQK